MLLSFQRNIEHPDDGYQSANDDESQKIDVIFKAAAFLSQTRECGANEDPQGESWDHAEIPNDEIT